MSWTSFRGSLRKVERAVRQIPADASGHDALAKLYSKVFGDKALFPEVVLRELGIYIAGFVVVRHAEREIDYQFWSDGVSFLTPYVVAEDRQSGPANAVPSPTPYDRRCATIDALFMAHRSVQKEHRASLWDLAQARATPHLIPEFIAKQSGIWCGSSDEETEPCVPYDELLLAVALYHKVLTRIAKGLRWADEYEFWKTLSDNRRASLTEYETKFAELLFDRTVRHVYVPQYPQRDLPSEVPYHQALHEDLRALSNVPMELDRLITEHARDWPGRPAIRRLLTSLGVPTDCVVTDLDILAEHVRDAGGDDRATLVTLHAASRFPLLAYLYGNVLDGARTHVVVPLWSNMEHVARDCVRARPGQEFELTPTRLTVMAVASIRPDPVAAGSDPLRVTSDQAAQALCRVLGDPQVAASLYGVEAEAHRSATRAVISMSTLAHNLGRHVLLPLSASAAPAGAQRTDAHAWAPLSRYLLGRFEYLASAARSTPAPGAISLLADVLLPLVSQEALWSNLAGAREFPADRIAFAIESVHADGSSTQRNCVVGASSLVPPPDGEDLGYRVLLPGGILGAHALYSLVECVVRNAVAHGPRAGTYAKAHAPLGVRFRVIEQCGCNDVTLEVSTDLDVFDISRTDENKKLGDVIQEIETLRNDLTLTTNSSGLGMAEIVQSIAYLEGACQHAANPPTEPAFSVADGGPGDLRRLVFPIRLRTEPPVVWWPRDGRKSAPEPGATGVTSSRELKTCCAEEPRVLLVPDTLLSDSEVSILVARARGTDPMPYRTLVVEVRPDRGHDYNGIRRIAATDSAIAESEAESHSYPEWIRVALARTGEEPHDLVICFGDDPRADNWCERASLFGSKLVNLYITKDKRYVFPKERKVPDQDGRAIVFISHDTAPEQYCKGAPRFLTHFKSQDDPVTNALIDYGCFSQAAFEAAVWELLESALTRVAIFDDGIYDKYFCEADLTEDFTKIAAARNARVHVVRRMQDASGRSLDIRGTSASVPETPALKDDPLQCWEPAEGSAFERRLEANEIDILVVHDGLWGRPGARFNDASLRETARRVVRVSSKGSTARFLPGELPYCPLSALASCFRTRSDEDLVIDKVGLVRTLIGAR